MVSDGCTGFPDSFLWWDWGACCVTHDYGGSNGALLDCLLKASPEWAWPMMAGAVALMILFRPLYQWLKGRQ